MAGGPSWSRSVVPTAISTAPLAVMSPRYAAPISRLSATRDQSVPLLEVQMAVPVHSRSTTQPTPTRPPAQDVVEVMTAPSNDS